MLGTGKTVGDVRRSNISLLLRLLYFEGPQSRKMLARKSRLTPAAVTMLITELQDRGCIINSDVVPERKRAGRLEQFVDLNYDGLYMAGVRIRRELLEVRIYSLRLECLAQMDLDPGMLADVDGFFEYVCDKISFLMFQHEVPAKALLGIGVSITGFVDPVRGVSIRSYSTLPDNVNIREQIESRMHVPVRVDNNVRSMLMAESAINHRSHGTSHLLVNYGPGVGGALAVEQEPYYGSANRSMELGHVVLNPEGKLCACGQRGCLETVVSYSTILCEAAALASPETTPVLHQEQQHTGPALAAVAASVQAGEAPTVALMTAKFDTFAKCLEGFTTILDPETVSIIGYIFDHKPLEELFLHSVRQYAPTLAGRLSLNPNAKQTERAGPVALVVHSFLSGQIPGGNGAGASAAATPEGTAAALPGAGQKPL